MILAAKVRRGVLRSGQEDKCAMSDLDRSPSLSTCDHEPSVADGAELTGRNARRMGRLLKQYRHPNNLRNLRHLALDLGSAVGLIATGVWLCEAVATGSLPVFVGLPLIAGIVVLIGAVQHRLAGLGHEGSHHVLFRHRWLNELVADWLCMFPIFTTTDHYRSLHLGHHRWVNDKELDPEFHNLGRARMLHDFPMSRWQFVTHFLSRILWPVSLLRYSWDNMMHGTIGITERGKTDWPVLRPLFLAGVAHVALVTLAMRSLATSGSILNITIVIFASSTMAGIAISLMPQSLFYRSGYPGCYGPKLRSWMRLTFFTLLQGGLVMGSMLSGADWLWYFRVLWLLPLITGFPYFMLLRDAWQHANTDEGRYTNSRVMFPDAFSRWAIFMYGSDIHLTHHLHPGVPHYKLRRLHETLKRRSKDYAEEVVETYGTFRSSRAGYPCLIDTIEG